MQLSIILSSLCKDSVSVKKQQFTADGLEVGKPWRKAYINSESDREHLRAELPEPYLSAALAVWGDTPTVEDVIENGHTT